MINSRDLDQLLPDVKVKVEAFIEACKAENIDLLITSTYRDVESQNALYAQGRTTEGHIVTDAKGGDSFHNYRIAVDVVPLINGKPDWNPAHPIWSRIGQIGKGCGLDWAGDWHTFAELAHFQYAQGATIASLKAGFGMA